MQVYSETAIHQINSLVEFLGYSLMVVLALMLVWGIKSGTVIKVADTHNQKQASDVTFAATTNQIPSMYVEKTSLVVEIDDTTAVAWAGR